MSLSMLMTASATFLQEGGPAAPQGNPLLAFVPFLLIFAVFYFLIIRPQNKRQKEHQAMVSSVEKGARIVTAGGIHGTVRGIDEARDIVVVEISDKVKIELSRGSIGRVVKD